MDGSTIHADAAKRHAVSAKRLREQEAQRCAEVETRFALRAHAD
ncbi:MAG: hypothetical protein WCG26_12995 [Chloroflexales bacterium]